MNRSNPLAMALVPILAAALCLAGCKKQETTTTTTTTESASAAAPMDSASGAMAPGSAASP